MKAVILDKSWLEERRRMGGDRRDEMWDGVLHMVPSPTPEHQRYSDDLRDALKARGRAKGLESFFETDLHRPGARGKDYRQPDLMFVQPERIIPGQRIEAPADLVVEVLSPGDESEEKLEFYADVGCLEAFYVDPKTCAFTLYRLTDGELVAQRPGSRGLARCETLDVTFATRKGPKLEITWDGGRATVEPFVPRRKKS
ncbi:MAG: Uma2 family endonuclease [Planctomycetota bacterium]